MHTPVLVEEAINALDVVAGEQYIDATAGEGGHLGEIVGGGGVVLAIDADPTQIDHLKKIYEHNERVTLATGNFAHIGEIAKRKGFTKVSGIIIDLGLSMRQLTHSKKGFSYKTIGDKLDMRLVDSAAVPASQLLNTLSADHLEDLIGRYGEEPTSRVISQKIVSGRRIKKIVHVGDLLARIDEAAGQGRQDIYRRVFQALRIAVNHELENLRAALASSMDLLKDDGRLVVISFHSLEDRIVKEFIRSRGLTALTKKPITRVTGPSYERAAKMRVIINKKVH